MRRFCTYKKTFLKNYINGGKNISAEIIDLKTSRDLEHRIMLLFIMKIAYFQVLKISSFLKYFD